MTETANGGQESSGQTGYQGPNAWRDASNAARAVADWLRPPVEVEAHFRAARVEMLKAVRALIDHKIERLTKTDQRGTKISVE